MLNTASVQGILYNHDLKLQKSGENSKNPGTEYIRGSISIAVDPEMTNVIDIHFLYVTENTKKGKNATFTVLKNIIDGTLPNYMEHNCDTTYLSVSTSIGLNEFYSKNSGEEQLVSNQRYIGGFVRHIKESDLNKALSSFEILPGERKELSLQKATFVVEKRRDYRVAFKKEEKKDLPKKAKETSPSKVQTKKGKEESPALKEALRYEKILMANLSNSLVSKERKLQDIQEQSARLRALKPSERSKCKYGLHMLQVERKKLR